MKKPIVKAIIRTDKADKRPGQCPICFQIRINSDKKKNFDRRKNISCKLG